MKSKIILVVIGYISLFVFPIITILYAIKKNEFTCSSGYNYSWCNKYIPSNITIIGFTQDNNVIGNYKIKYGNYYNTITCNIKGLNNNDFAINDSFIGFYEKRNVKECLTKKKGNNYIKKKDKINRINILIPIGISLTIFSFLFFSCLIPCIILLYEHNLNIDYNIIPINNTKQEIPIAIAVCV